MSRLFLWAVVAAAAFGCDSEDPAVRQCEELVAATCELACDCTDGPECAFVHDGSLRLYRDFEDCLGASDCSGATSPFVDCLQAYKLEGCVEVDGVIAQRVPDPPACGGED